MNTWIALFRGVNVGGHARLPMKDLRALLESMGFEAVATYIQSGNAVFRSPEADPAALAARIGGEVGRRFGFEPELLVLGIDELEAAVRSNPFPEAAANTAADGKALHANFLAEAPAAPDCEALARLARYSERFELKGRVFYLYAPEGIARSKLAAGAEKALGVRMTGRNWRSVTKILELASSL